MFYFTESFYRRRFWERDRAERGAERFSLVCTKKDPYLLHKMWQRWVRRKFYQGVVFRFFDLGDLAFCPDRRAEQSWKDQFGKKGLLHLFRPQYVGRSWEGFWGSVGENSSLYLEKAEGLLLGAIKMLPEEQSFPFRDALEHGWIPEFLESFQGLLTQDLWESGIVQRDNPDRLTPNHEAAAWRMLEGEFGAES